MMSGPLSDADDVVRYLEEFGFVPTRLPREAPGAALRFEVDEADRFFDDKEDVLVEVT